MKKELLLCLVILIYSCKSESKSTIENKKEEKKELIVSMEFKTNQEDDLVFILNDIVIDEIQKKSIKIIERVIPTSSTDKFIGRFGEGNVSNKFEIDLGKNVLKEFQIISINFVYGEKALDIRPDELKKYFAFSKFSIYNESSQKIITKKVDNYHFPKLYARKKLWDELLN